MVDREPARRETGFTTSIFDEESPKTQFACLEFKHSAQGTSSAFDAATAVAIAATANASSTASQLPQRCHHQSPPGRPAVGAA